MHKFFIVALKLKEISMCTGADKFHGNVLEKHLYRKFKL